MYDRAIWLRRAVSRSEESASCSDIGAWIASGRFSRMRDGTVASMRESSES